MCTLKKKKMIAVVVVPISIGAKVAQIRMAVAPTSGIVKPSRGGGLRKEFLWVLQKHF
jgi:hypothetical protein